MLYINSRKKKLYLSGFLKTLIHIINKYLNTKLYFNWMSDELTTGAWWDGTQSIPYYYIYIWMCVCMRTVKIVNKTQTNHAKFVDFSDTWQLLSNIRAKFRTQWHYTIRRFEPTYKDHNTNRIKNFPKSKLGG